MGQITRYAAELAECHGLHRALGLVTSCRDLVKDIDDPRLEHAVIGLREIIHGIMSDIEIAVQDAEQNAADAYGDHEREQAKTEAMMGER